MIGPDRLQLRIVVAEVDDDLVEARLPVFGRVENSPAAPSIVRLESNTTHEEERFRRRGINRRA